MKTFRVERAIDIAAPAERIAALIADFHAWTKWSPWEDRDPQMQRSYGKVASGVGATYEWQGNKKVGSGRMAILEATPSRIVIDLQFLKPFKAHNQAEFALAPSSNGTRVTWAMTGPVPVMMRVMGLFTDMDKMIGADFEAGLANLKSVAEGS